MPYYQFLLKRNQYASENKHLIYSNRDDWSLKYNVSLLVANVHQAVFSKD